MFQNEFVFPIDNKCWFFFYLQICICLIDAIVRTGTCTITAFLLQISFTEYTIIMTIVLPYREILNITKGKLLVIRTNVRSAEKDTLTRLRYRGIWSTNAVKNPGFSAFTARTDRSEKVTCLSTWNTCTRRNRSITPKTRRFSKKMCNLRIVKWIFDVFISIYFTSHPERFLGVNLNCVIYIFYLQTIFNVQKQKSDLLFYEMYICIYNLRKINIYNRRREFLNKKKETGSSWTFQ